MPENHIYIIIVCDGFWLPKNLPYSAKGSDDPFS